MSNMKERLRQWAICRPILGIFVKDRAIVLRPTNYHVVRHTRFAIYWRDPYGLRENYTGHLSEWGKLRHAWRFGSVELATGVLSEMNETGIIESYPYDD
jgi:hypothetical protein